MLLEFVFLGVLQGIFEWLPISSQANLTLIMILLGSLPQNAVKMSIFLHTGTLLSALIYFRKDVLSILKDFLTKKPSFKSNRLTTFLLISTIITGAVGFFIYRFIEISAFYGGLFIALIGIFLIITGLVQKLSQKRSGSKNTEDLNFKDSILLGVCQALSAIPGISRSGITVSALLFRNYNSKDSLRISFLMSIPAVLGAEIGLVLLGGIPDIPLSYIILVIFFSFFIGILSIHILLKLSERISFWKFVIVIGILAIISAAFI